MSEFVFNCFIDFVVIINTCELSQTKKVQIVDLILEL